MDAIKIFFSTGFLYFILHVTPIVADDVKVQVVDEPKWYEKPEITITIMLASFAAISKLINDNLVYKQKQIVNEALDTFKLEISEERKLYFSKLEKLESCTDSKLNILLQNQNKFGLRFDANSDELKNVEIRVAGIETRIDTLENRVGNINTYLERRNNDFSTHKRL